MFELFVDGVFPIACKTAGFFRIGTSISPGTKRFKHNIVSQKSSAITETQKGKILMVICNIYIYGNGNILNYNIN